MKHRIAAVAVLLFACVRGSSAASYDRFQTVAEIDGAPVAAGELKIFFDEEKAGVFDDFHRRYGIDFSKDFWTTVVGGETPLNVAVSKAMNTLKRVKTEQILLQRYAIVSDIGYREFLAEFDRENRRRLEGNEVIYGPKQYSETIYYDYLLTNRLNSLRRLIGNDNFRQTIDRRVNSSSVKIFPTAYRQMEASLR